MPVRLRYLAHDLEVPTGEFLIGRSPDCQLSLDDPLVSRRHAVLIVRPEAVYVEDIASRNGVLVNSKRIQGQTRVADGDQITIGSQVMTLLGVPGPGQSDASSVEPIKRSATFDDIITSDLTDEHTVNTADGKVPGPPPVAPDRRISSLSLIGGLAEKALVMGRAEESERILSRSLREILLKARAREAVHPDLAEKASFYATRLALGTGRGLWVDYIFELYGLLGILLPAKLVDELYTVMRKVKTVDKALIATYTERLRKHDQLGPSERFIRQRIEGLERLGAMK